MFSGKNVVLFSQLAIAALSFQFTPAARQTCLGLYRSEGSFQAKVCRHYLSIIGSTHHVVGGSVRIGNVMIEGGFRPRKPTWLQMQRDRDSDDDNEESDEIELPEDWRDFRAKLVLQQKQQSPKETSLTNDRTSWAYDAGIVIEQGSIILSRPEQDFQYNGLSQQYFHKSAILVLYHDEDFTKGIILNRPTNLDLTDSDFIREDGSPAYVGTDDGGKGGNGDENSWRIFFGGDVAGLYSDSPEIVCLHSIRTELAKTVSNEVIKDIFMTNYEGARTLIDAGEASSLDFMVFCGYAGWGKGQLLDELERESWYMIAADSGSVLEEVTRQRNTADDPRGAGIETWEMLMRKIGKYNEGLSLGESFNDLMLKEYASEKLVLARISGFGEGQEDADFSGTNQVSSVEGSLPGAVTFDSIDKVIKRAMDVAQGRPVGTGAIVRGSSAVRSPFLLSSQEYHKSVMLVYQDDDKCSVGLMLNHPTTEVRKVQLSDGATAEFIVRYGGPFGIRDAPAQPIIWIHCKNSLKERLVGATIGDGPIWACTEAKATEAINLGVANQRDFMLVKGFSVWEKVAGGVAGGVMGELLDGRLELVSPSRVDGIWTLLSSQNHLSTSTIDANLMVSNRAWEIAGEKEGDSIVTKGNPMVYNSTVEVSELTDDALRYWVTTFLLGEPLPLGKYTAFE